MNYCALSLVCFFFVVFFVFFLKGNLQIIYISFPNLQISCHLTIWCVLEYLYIPRELSLKKLL